MKIYKLNMTYILFLVIMLLQSCSKDNSLLLEQKLQNALDKGIKKYDVEGVSAAILFPDGKKWIGTSGISHDTITIKPEMVFAIGSVTKNFVAALTLKLAEEGKLSLCDPISSWLPEYPYVKSEITIRQLLNHTSGIYMFWSNQEIWDDLKKDRTKIWKPQEVLNYIREPYFDPGQGFHYSNTNYLLLAMIITKATGSRLSSEFDTYFWKPLNINSASLSIEEKIPDNRVHVYGDYFNNDGSHLDLTLLPQESHESITYGSSGIYITASDLALWSHSLFGGKILNKESMAEMLDFYTFMPGGNMSGYGLGVQLYRNKYANGEKAYGHSGAHIGNSTYMVYIPKHHLSVVVMINNMNHQCSEAILKNLIKISLKELNDFSIIPAFDFFPLGYVIIAAATYWLVYILIRIRLKSKRKIISGTE